MRTYLSSKLRQELEDELDEILESHWESIAKEQEATGLKLTCAFLLGFFLATIISKWLV